MESHIIHHPQPAQIVSDLLSLATAIETEHAEAQRAVRDALEHARRAGELLISAKAAVPHGQWLAWLAEHTTLTPRNAQYYMTASRNLSKPEIANTNTVSHLTMREARQARPGVPANASEPFARPDAKYIESRKRSDLDNRIVAEIVLKSSLEATDVNLINFKALDPECIAYWVATLRQATKSISRLASRLEREIHPATAIGEVA